MFDTTTIWTKNANFFNRKSLVLIPGKDKPQSSRMPGVQGSKPKGLLLPEIITLKRRKKYRGTVISEPNPSKMFECEKKILTQKIYWLTLILTILDVFRNKTLYLSVLRF